MGVLRPENRKQSKPSLIRIVYIYPILFFMIGLSIVFTYYSWLQIHKYRGQLAKLKAEFPEKQRTELKTKVLLLKDYIFWVRSHPESHIKEHIGKKINSTIGILQQYEGSIGNATNVLPSNLTDTLLKTDPNSIVKILVFDEKFKIVYPPSQNGLARYLQPSVENLLKFENFSSVDSVSSSNSSAFPTERCILIKDSKVKGLSVGVLYQPMHRNEIIQEVVLDSLSKIKYSNDEYVIINTFDGFALLSKGKMQIPPINISKSTETNWNDIFVKELEFAKHRDGGYYTYFWRNQNDRDRSEKTSYFSGITDWGWIIGTGFFTSDINPVIEKMHAELWNDILMNLARFLVFLILLSLIVYFTIRYFAIKAKSNILLFLHFFKRADQGKQIIDSSKLAFGEFDTLAQAANQMIAERERIKSVLSAEKSRLRYMIDAIPDLIFFKDVNSNFVGCNRAFEKYINKKSENIVGLSEFDLFQEQQAEGFIQSDKHIIQSVLPERSTNWIEYPNGQRLLFDTLKTPYFDSDNNLLGIIGISRDITEMEETRQRLILAKEKAEESDRLKTAFLANMSHEIRTPMNAIIGFSDLLSEDDLPIEDKVDFILKIKSAGSSLMSLINDIIDIAKIEAGQLKVTESECDLNHLLSTLYGTFKELKNSSGKTSIDLKLSLPENGESTIVMTDPLRLQQILNNFLSNALKFTEIGYIEFGYTIQPETISFYVKDTGIGILPSNQKLLFQRFSQIDPSTTRRYGGAGLGLAISKNLVTLLGGSIILESIPGKGSTFSFTIPNKSTLSKPFKVRTPEPYSVNWKGKTILIAEDMMQNFLLLEALLRRSGVRLLHALNGQIAIDIAKSEPDIDLILMDIQLPVKTGYEALKEILEIRPDIKVMSYTAFALPHEREKSLSAGFVDFIPKPIKAETLIPMLDKYLQNQG